MLSVALCKTLVCYNEKSHSMCDPHEDTVLT